MRILSLIILLFSITSLFSQSTWNTNFVGHWGTYNTTRGIATDGNYTYACEFGHFVIRDISDPNHCFEVGSLYFDRAMNVTLHNGVAFVASFAKEFMSIDISNPTNPKTMGSFEITDGNYINDFCIAHDFAYLACHKIGLAVYNISDPENMVLAGNYDSVNFTTCIDVSGQYVYLIDQPSLHVIDISEPTFPDKISTYEIDIPENNWINNIRINDNYAYVETNYNGLIVLDINDPENILEIGRYFQENYYSSGINFHNGLAYISVPDSGFLVLNISDPANIFTIGSVDAQGGNNAIYGNYVYLTGRGYTIIDIENNEQPIIISQYDTPDEIWDVELKDDYAFLAANDSGMRVLDISDKSKPIEIGSFSTPHLINNIDIHNNYAYLPAWDSGLYIVDVSTPENPFQVGHFNIEFAFDIEVKGNYAYLINARKSSLIVINILEPSNPVEVGRYTNNSAAYWDIVLSGDYAYLASDEYGLSIIDISDPEDPYEVSNYTYPMLHIFGLDVEGSFAYLTGSPGLMIIDISDPFHPIEISSGPYSGTSNVLVENNFAYVTNYSDILTIYDVTDPENKEEIGYYKLEGVQSEKLAKLDEEIFISCHESGLLILHDWLITSTDENKENNSMNFVSVFPNPTSDQITFQINKHQSSNLELTIFNQNGQTVEKLKVADQNHIFQLNVDTYPPGIYYYKIAAGKTTDSGKFLVIK